jgi:hypothetical protein
MREESEPVTAHDQQRGTSLLFWDPVIWVYTGQGGRHGVSEPWQIQQGSHRPAKGPFATVPGSQHFPVLNLELLTSAAEPAERGPTLATSWRSGSSQGTRAQQGSEISEGEHAWRSAQ